MAIVKNAVMERLGAGKIAASFNVSRLRTVEIPQIAKACGFHWIFIDLEHSTMDLDMAGQICAAALPTAVTPIVRVPEGDVNRFPHVQNAVEARAFTAACRFPPIGTRSLIYGGPQLEYENLPPGEVMAGINGETLVVMMIETPEAVANAAEIAAVDGVDLLLVGGSDLSATMGIAGQFSHPDFLAAIPNDKAAVPKNRRVGLDKADDARALIAQQHGGKGGGGACTEVEDGNPIQNCGHDRSC